MNDLSIPLDRVSPNEVGELFERALEVPTKERPALLDRLSPGKIALRSEVERLLAADHRAADFLRTSDGANPPTEEKAEGRRLGPWQLGPVLGSGGMCTVYLAERADEAFAQRVAVKVFHGAPHRPDLAQRFRAERQILARLEHPRIARLIDGGESAEGWPYLVMEHVDGPAVDRWCDERKADLETRIGLFLEICAAVAAAHARGIVHRDLKPSNILMAADGSPRLLDFGIAKVLDGPAGRPEHLTATGERWLTPTYASPEQLEGKRIGPESDVYSAGVLLFLLLTGRLPYRLAGDRIGSLEQAVVEGEAEHASATVRRDPTGSRLPGETASAAELAARRSATSQSLAQRLAGDLDTILAKTLAKEPTRRYHNITNLAADLRRFLDQRPIAARPASLLYRLRRLAGRHRLGTGAAVATGLVILGLAAALVWLSSRLSREQQASERLRAKASQVAALLDNTLTVADPTRPRGAEPDFDGLKKGAAVVLNDLAELPEEQARLALRLGSIFADLGQADEALPLLEMATRQKRRLRAPRHVEVAEALTALASAQFYRRDLPAAEASFREALSIYTALPQALPRAQGEAANGVASALVGLGRRNEAEALFRQAYESFQELSPPDPEGSAVVLANVAILQQQRGQFEAALRTVQEELALLRESFGDRHRFVPTLHNNLGTLELDLGHFDAALSYYEKAYQLALPIFGKESEATALYLANLAHAFRIRHQLARAEPLARQALKLRIERSGAESDLAAVARLILAGVLAEQPASQEEAAALFEESLASFRQASGQDPVRLAEALFLHAEFLDREGETARALAEAQEAVEIRRRAQGEQHPYFGASLALLGSLELKQQGPEKAEPLLRQGLTILTQRLPAQHWRTGDAQLRLAGCLAAAGRRDEARPWAERGLQAIRVAFGPDHPRTAAAARTLHALKAKAR